MNWPEANKLRKACSIQSIHMVQKSQAALANTSVFHVFLETQKHKKKCFLLFLENTWNLKKRKKVAFLLNCQTPKIKVFLCFLESHSFSRFPTEPPPHRPKTTFLIYTVSTSWKVPVESCWWVWWWHTHIRKARNPRARAKRGAICDPGLFETAAIQPDFMDGMSAEVDSHTARPAEWQQGQIVLLFLSIPVKLQDETNINTCTRFRVFWPSPTEWPSIIFRA